MSEGCACVHLDFFWVYLLGIYVSIYLFVKICEQREQDNFMASDLVIWAWTRAKITCEINGFVLMQKQCKWGQHLPRLVTGGQVFLCIFWITRDKNGDVSRFDATPICKGRFNDNPLCLRHGKRSKPKHRHQVKQRGTYSGQSTLGI